MPPSGFNQKAVKGLLLFLQACYEDVLVKIKSGTEPETAIQEEIDEMNVWLNQFSLKK